MNDVPGRLSGVVAGTEDGGADPDHGAAVQDGELQIFCHAHREGIDRGILLRKPGEQSLHAQHLLCQDGVILSVLRYGHQTAQHQAFGLIDQLGQPENLLFRSTGFAALSANIDLQTDI